MSDQVSYKNKEFTALQQQTGLSNIDLAKWLDVTPRQVSRWRNGESKVPWSVMLALGYSIKYGEL